MPYLSQTLRFLPDAKRELELENEKRQQQELERNEREHLEREQLARERRERERREREQFEQEQRERERERSEREHRERELARQREQEEQREYEAKLERERRQREEKDEAREQERLQKELAAKESKQPYSLKAALSALTTITVIGSEPISASTYAVETNEEPERINYQVNLSRRSRGFRFSKIIYIITVMFFMEPYGTSKLGFF